MKDFLSAHLRAFVLLLFACLALPAHAQLAIEITGAGATRIPVIIPVFENEQVLPNSVSDIVRADLERSGLFQVMDNGVAPISANTLPDLAGLRSRGADAALVERVVRLKKGAAFKVMQIPPVLTVGDHPIVPEFKQI